MIHLGPRSRGTDRVVSVDEVDHVLDDTVAGGLGCLTHHAEVEVHEVTAGGGQQVARVRVCTRGSHVIDKIKVRGSISAPRALVDTWQVCRRALPPPACRAKLGGVLRGQGTYQRPILPRPADESTRFLCWSV